MNIIHQRTDRSGEPEFNYWVEQLLVRLYLSPGRTPHY